ncbi:MFS general substrate transporter [Stemphylium lycopersici]|uniref:MFS general substrate transporter n=1 Tax=Stemphylium lycopersici TaxID=183478 RepID=A0A364N4M9_STELY|nr:mfs multidrug transporter [Stemphylium lycopersici]RAR08121.1 MFS general substrate transporter [Stemphylium lycopersici]RAR11741.1 MFS general substrate transporter [Stemphylium lycopersici]
MANPISAANEKELIAHEPMHNEDLEHAATHGTYLDKDEASHLSEEHRQYLLERHAAIIPAYEEISEDLGVSIQRASYLTSLQIAILGAGPLFWRPLSTRYGRRPIFIISLIGSLVFNIGCAKSQSYAAMATCRAFQSFFICPPNAIGSAVVVETFFKKERAKFMGMWTVMITLGIPLAPLIFGFVTYNVGYRWIYWILAMINGAQAILYTIFGPETRFMRHDNAQHAQSGFAAYKEMYLKFRRIDPTPITLYEFISPLRLFRYPSSARNSISTRNKSDSSSLE